MILNVKRVARPLGRVNDTLPKSNAIRIFNVFRPPVRLVLSYTDK